MSVIDEKAVNQACQPDVSATPEQRVFLACQKTADALMADLADVLKPSNLSPTQYNVLRILRAASQYGLPLGEIAQHMITRDPDLTRLVDRLESRGLVERHRCDKDRRRIYGRITEDGLKLLVTLDEVIVASHARQLGHLGQEKLAQLTSLLEEARSVVCQHAQASCCDGGERVEGDGP